MDDDRARIRTEAVARSLRTLDTALTALEVCASCVVVRAKLALGPASHSLGSPAGLPFEGRHADARAAADRLTRLVDALLARRPLRARCLVRALVVRRLLRRRGIPCQLVIRVWRRSDWLSAHAETRVPEPGEPALSLELVVES